MNFIRMFFTPAIAVLQRLRYPWKFGLMGVVAIVTIGFFMVSLASWTRSSLAAAQHESLGLELYQPTLAALHKVHDYVGLSLGAKGADELKPLALQAEKAVDAAMAELAEVVTDDAEDLHLEASWKMLEAEWGKLKAAKGKEARDMQDAHKPLINGFMLFMRDLAEASGLSRDPDPRGAYLADAVVRKVPEVGERLSRINASGILVLGVPGFAKEWRRMGNQVEELERFRGDLVDTMLRAAGDSSGMAADMQAAAKALESSNAAFVELAKKNVLSGTRGVTAKVYAEAGRKALNDYYAIVEERIFGELDSIISVRKFSLGLKFWLTNLIGLAGVLLLAYISIGMFMAIMRSVEELTEGARHIGEGDLTHRVVFSAQDELKEVADQFNGMAEGFSAVIHRVQVAASEATSAAGQLSSSADIVSHSSERQSEAAASMAATVQEMTVGIGEIARYSEQAEQTAAHSGEIATQGGDVVIRSVNEIERIADAVAQSSKVIDELNNNSEAISAIVNTIKEIAEQTNLLALNAAIEAARAGETGRGFAVVADEVRKLAERTARATQEITGMIDAIQWGTDQAVESMQKGVARVQEGVALTRRAGQSMDQINEAANQVVGSASEISMAMREQTAASAEIARSVEHIAQMAEENSSAIVATAGTARELESLAQQLNDQMRRFKVA